MTLRDLSVRNVPRKGDRSSSGRLRDKRRRMERRLLSESLEQRQLLAGPEIAGIQPSEGALLNDGSILSFAPSELVFQFDDDANLDPSTLSAIRITQAGEGGAFDSATVLSDLGTNSVLTVEFRAIESGHLGNGIEVEFTSNSLATVPGPVISVTDRVVGVEVSSNPAAETTMQDLISAISDDASASALLEVIQVTGSSLAPFGQSIPGGLSLTLEGANSAEAVTDFGTNGAVRVRFVSPTPGPSGLETVLEFEQRNFGGPASPVIVVNGSSVRVQLNSTSGSETSAQEFLNSINGDPAASALVSASLQQGDIETLIGASLALPGSLTLSGVSDVAVRAGYIGFGDSSREVVFRFAEPLKDDLYQIDILGNGPDALRNLDGELFQDGSDLSQQFSVNLGPQVAAVVPEPVRRAANGDLEPAVGKIEIHFNNDTLDSTRAEDPSFYAMIFTRDTVNNTDDVLREPISVSYSSTTNIATLDFGSPLSRMLQDQGDPNSGFLTGAVRLRVGSDRAADLGLGQNPYLEPVEVALDPVTQEPGDSFATAFEVGTLLTNPISSTTNTSVRMTSEIFNTSPYGLDLPGPDMDGVREIRADDPSRLLRTVPLDYVRNGADAVDGISVMQYNFASSWLGDDPTSPGIKEDRTYFSVISQQQKDRVREVMTQYSEYLGISFIEVEGAPTSDAFISIAVGDIYGADETATSGDGGLAVAMRDRNGDGIDDLAVMDFQDFDESIDDTFGGEFTRGALFAVGQLLGYGYADDLPQPVSQSSDFIFSPGTDNEPAYPSVADIVHGQYLYRPDSTDIDLYRFELPTSGVLSTETVAERLGDPSLLDTVIRVYRLGSDGAFEEVAYSNDYFSNDSFVSLEVNSGTYMIGVSARGNSDYDPIIPGTGFGGLTEGSYELIIDFSPTSTNGLTDTTGVALDGDGDLRPGDVFNFWFVPNDVNDTFYVDKAATSASGNLGTLSNPYREIDQAIAAATEGITIRIVGNGGVDGQLETLADNHSYQIGYTSNGLALPDGTSLDLPKGVRMIIDSGAILKMSRSRIGVGSASLADQSDSSLQLLGTPSIITANGLPARDSLNAIIPGSVFLTSINDDSIGAGNTTGSNPVAGEWGGLDFRGDLDSQDESRRNRELEGVFLNHVQHADIRYGGGQVLIGGQSVVVSPIDMAVTRPTIINSSIRESADAAIAATPDTFTETRFTDPYYQASGAFTPDYDRVGPHVWGNTVVDNTINGLFVRVRTRAGDVLETISTSARFDDGDITIVLTETLQIEGTAGGPVLQSTAPSSLLVRLSQATVGDIPANGEEYIYRITNVDANGLESASSLPTVSITLSDPSGTAGIQLEQLPEVSSSSDYVGRRLYRAEVALGGIVGEYRLVQELNATDTLAVDRAESGSTLLSTEDSVLRSRLDASLVIDPGTVVKIDGARIEARFGGNLIAEGAPGLPVVFTSLEDQRYGGGGTFNTNDRPEDATMLPGDWGGIFIGQTGSASIDQAVIAGAGGTTRIEGGFASFNPIEVHQAVLRLSNSRLEFNADGRGQINGDRVGRGDNSDATVFVRAAHPVILYNEFVDNNAAAISIDINSFSSAEVFDPGRATGGIDSSLIMGNAGPLVQGNALQDNAINGMVVRGGQLATEGVLDDVDIVHVVRDAIEVPNKHIFGGMRLESDARGSLVVKFESAENENAGLVIGGSLLSGDDEFRDISGRIGGSLQLLGHPDFPVVLTTLADDTTGAGFTLDGRSQRDTNGDGIAFDDLANQGIGGLPVLPIGPEVNRGLTIDNDVDINLPGYFEATIADSGDVNFGSSGVTVEELATSTILVNQNYIFGYNTFVTTATGVEQLSATTITQPATLIADDVVESRGTFAGPNGLVSWTTTSLFEDGISRLITVLDLDSGLTTLGDIQVVSYLDEDVGIPSDDILVTTGTPGAEGFRAFTIDTALRVGFSHGGHYIEDGINLVNASYTGWAADAFPQLLTAIAAGTQTFSVAGDIDLTDLPASADPVFGQKFGPNDATTGFAWNTDSISTNARITNFLELLSRDPAVAPPLFDFEAGLWDGVVVREGADDRNVAAFAENEPVRSGFVDTNAIPGQSQFLGEIAPNLQSGDENRRLGFIVNGSVTQRDDLDVYSFMAESGTEVFLDIDRTGSQLDSVIELINANGVVLASSNDSILAETDAAAIYSDASINPDAAQQLSVVSQPLPVQQITIDQAMVDATGGELSLSLSGFDDPVIVLVEDFQIDPATAIQAALADAYPDELGSVVSSLLQRQPTDDFVIQLVFNDQQFTADSLPTITVDGSGVIGAVVTSSVIETVLLSQLQDDYSTNTKDAGFRVRLPGELGTRNLYHVRVRSSNTVDPLDFTTLNDPSMVRDGLTVGSYEMQIRLQEDNERAGTQVRLADVRFATTGLQIIGQPLHSPLLGEEHETTASNDSLAEAQPLGLHNITGDQTAASGPLQSDQLAKAFSGTIDTGTDVDWYRFDVTYENITRDAAALYLSTVFDLDYASGYARTNMSMNVFNGQGELVLMGNDSNIADDLPSSAYDNSTDDMSRGSASVEDPFIGVAELAEGTYFIAVSNQQQVPEPLDQFFNANSLNPLLRVEPIDSVKRIVEDRIGSTGGGTGDTTETPLLFDDGSILEHSFDDSLLYVNTATGLLLVNPATGTQYGTVGGLGERIDDIAFRANGELFGYTGNGGTDASAEYVRIDTGDGSLTVIGLTGMENRHQGTDPAEPLLTETSNDGFQVNAISIRDFQGAESGFLVGERPSLQLGLDYITNVLYEFDDATGEILGQGGDIPVADAGAGTAPREIGQIDTNPNSVFPNQLGITNATEVGNDGVAVPSLFDGDLFTLSNVTDFVTFEFDQDFTLFADGAQPVRDGDSVTVDGLVFEFETSQRLQLSEVAPLGLLSEGATISIEGTEGIVTFEFVRFGDPAQDNIGIAIVDSLGTLLTADQITADLVAAINANVIDVAVIGLDSEVHFSQPALSLTTLGPGVSILGSAGLNDPMAIVVPVSATLGQEELIGTLAAVLRGQGFAVSDNGAQLSLPNVVSLAVQPDPALNPSAFTITGTPGVAAGNVPITLLPTDTAEVVADRISAAVQLANGTGDLPNVTAVPNGRSLTILGGFVGTTSGNLVAGGLPNGGTITGVELVNDRLFAVSDTGGLYEVNAAELSASTGNQRVGSYVVTSTDLIGINFSGLRAGPMSVEEGAFSDMLFGITEDGDIYAFNTRGELEPVFSGGRSMVSTGVAGALGLDFATVDYNLWHTSGTRGGDAGHGIDALTNGTRESVAGGTSLAFNYENAAFGANYSSTVEQPVAEPRTDGTTVPSSFNVPGGSSGAVESNSFSLVGYASADQPTLYYNYFAANDGSADRLRVYVITEGGVQHLVTSNTLARGADVEDDEFDDPTQTGQYDDDVDVSVQQLFDNTASWRQARIDLGSFAGQDNLQLRVEYSTGGTTLSSSDALRVTSGRVLSNSVDREFVVQGSLIAAGSETFSIQLAPVVTVPSGSQLAELYLDVNETAVLTIDGQDYLLNDGSRTAAGGQVDIDLLAGAPVGTTLDQLSAAEIATVVTSAINGNLPANQTASSVFLSDLDEIPPGSGRNDLVYEATSLPYPGGNFTIEGAGRLGTNNDPAPPTNVDDVDLMRVEVTAGTFVEVDLDLIADDMVGTPLDSVIRFFDAAGNELAAVQNPAEDKVQYTATTDGLMYIGFSGIGNETYDPRIENSTQAGQTGSYTAVISMTLPSVYRAEGNVIEFQGGQQEITVSQPGLFSVSADPGLIENPVSVSRFMSAAEVAAEVRRALANRFVHGNVDLLPTAGASIRLPALSIVDAGPFHVESERHGEQFASGVLAGTRDNAHEGVYLDDFIVGFAERGEVVTGSNPVNTPFITDLRPTFSTPADPTSGLLTGSYTVEIRDGSEYVNSMESEQFRAFATNDRLVSSVGISARPAAEISDGDVFTISNGRSEFVFEFDQIEIGNGVQPGRVAVPFTLEKLDAVSGFTRAETAGEVARNIITAINRSDVQSVLEVPALLSGGIDDSAGNHIDLFGEAIVGNQSGAIVSVNQTRFRGDENRDRDSQGVILVENSRFLFNEEHGIVIDHGFTADVAGQTTSVITRYPRNLVELNTENLASGVVVQSNVIAFNELGGLKIDGVPQNSGETFRDPVWYDRILNNTIIGGNISPGRSAPPQAFNGVLFPAGVVSFADSVVDYQPNLGGIPPIAIHQVPANALGVPDAPGIGAEPDVGDTTVSLGFGGSLTLQFVDNLLAGNGNAQPDLVVFESGEIESVLVEISRDGTTFFDVGIVGGLANSLDIDAHGFGIQDRFAFVRLTDLRQGDPSSTSAGADIDAVGAISSASVEAYTPNGTGIELTGNAAPVLLNNIISNSDVGIELDPTYALPLLGGNSYYRNTQNVTTDASVGQFAQELADAEVIFVGAPTLIFAPAANASIIDSSIDSLEDRPSLTSVKNPLGLPPSPILAPDFDVNGQLRVDDPTVQTPNGMGELVFKDRGAFDRGDLVGPRVVLLTPRAPSLGADAGVAEVLGEIPLFFEIQLIDGISPADITPGTGIDDYSVSSQSVLLLKDGVAQVEGVDYRFGYHPSTNVIRLTPIAGAWEPDSTYVIRMIDATDAIVRAADGNTYSDGEKLHVIDSEGNTKTFEYETGLTVTINPLINLALADGITLDVFDGVSTVTFELDDDLSSDPLNTAVNVPSTVPMLAAAITDAINSSILNLNSIAHDNSIQLLGSNPLSNVLPSSALLSVAGEIGVSIGFGLRIPNDGAGVSDTLEEGQTFSVRQGSLNSITFEFDSDNNVDTDETGTSNVAIPFSAVSTLDQIADAIVLAVSGAPLGLDPANAGSGRIALGGDANYSLDLSDTVLMQIGFPGEFASVEVQIEIDSTDDVNALNIAAVMNAAAMIGVTTSVVDSQIFLEGTGNVSGVGAVEIIPIRDEVGNLLQSNQLNGRTELIIYVGGGFDYGDAAAPYLTTMAEGGPRHGVEQGFALSPVDSERAVTADSEPQLVNLDEDNGVTVVGTLQTGFTANFQVEVKNEDSREFYLDAWFDWDANGVFDIDEVSRYGSIAALGVVPISSGTSTIAVTIPSNSATGEIYSRFRLSEIANLGPNGDANSGEVEDYAFQILSNPFQNQADRFDVNDSGATTPIDVLQIINALARNSGSDIYLDVLPLPSMLPEFPDVNGDGKVSTYDALQVINQLGLLYNSGSGEGEATAFLPVAGGVMASTSTAFGDALLNDLTLRREAEQTASQPGEDSSESSVSVFDSPAAVGLDDVVDSLASDTASVREDDDVSAIDALFASL
ncbi:MAG: GEVED domain-containing protein [Rubripirellula sp.]|nr:GEVED domain-containing protein [Rubripirellula sp.]